MALAMPQLLLLMHSQAGTWRRRPLPKSQRAQRCQVPACMHLAANIAHLVFLKLFRPRFSSPKAERLANCDGANSELAGRVKPARRKPFPTL